MNTKLVILFALVNIVFAQYGPEFDGGAMQPNEGEEYAAPQADSFDGDNAEVPFESTQEGAFEGGEYGGPAMQPGMQGPGMQGMAPGPYGGGEQMAPQYGGYNPEETMHRPKFMPFKK